MQVPERLLVYHAGTLRTTFLAMLKVISLVGMAFFSFLVAPATAAADQPLSQVVYFVLIGIVPFAAVTYISSPFVAFVHLRLPAYARHPDREVLRRFVHSLPASTQLDMTTMNLVGRPRVATVAVGDLVPARERLLIVNLVDARAGATAAAVPKQQTPATGITFSSRFPFVRLPPPTRFSALAANNSRGVPYGWVWNELLAVIARRAKQP